MIIIKTTIGSWFSVFVCVLRTESKTLCILSKYIPSHTKFGGRREALELTDTARIYIGRNDLDKYVSISPMIPQF